MIYIVLGLMVFIVAVVGFIISVYIFMVKDEQGYARRWAQLYLKAMEELKRFPSVHVHRTNVELMKYDSRVIFHERGEFMYDPYYHNPDLSSKFVPVHDEKMLQRMIEDEVRKLARAMIKDKAVDIEIRSNDGSGDHAVDFSRSPHTQELRVTALLVPSNTHTKNLYVEHSSY